MGVSKEQKEKIISKIHRQHDDRMYDNVAQGFHTLSAINLQGF